MRRLLDDRAGSAAAEMALVLPLLLVLAVGPLELGNYFMNQHTLVKALRDGAVFASRQSISNYDCAAPGNVPEPLRAQVENLVRKGELSGGNDLLANWGVKGVTVSFACFTATSGQTMSGIYSANSGKVPVVTVAASLTYRLVISNIGFNTTGLTLSGSQQSAVTGI